MPASIKHLKELFSKDRGQIVLLAKWPQNNLYYQVRLLKLDEKRERCYVKYEDNTEVWAGRHDVHIQFSSNDNPYEEVTDIFCCLCGDGTSNEPDQIILCDVCQQGYHQDCHEPRIRQAEVENETKEWSCQTCTYIMKQLNPMPNTSTPKVKVRRAKKESPRRAVLKVSQANKPASPKKQKPLKKEKTDKKRIKEPVDEPEVRADTPVYPGSDGSDAECAVTSSEGEPAKPVTLPDGTVYGGNKEIVKAAKKLVDNVGTEEFLGAVIEMPIPKVAKAVKASKKAPAKKSTKNPVPPA